MLIRRKRRWESAENQVTDEALFWNRRRVIGAAVAAGGLGVTGALGSETFGLRGGVAVAADGASAPGAPFTPTPALNPAYADAGRPVTDESVSSTYNNFYEYTPYKDVYKYVDTHESAPWSVTLDGLVEQEKTIAMEDLLAMMPIEERIIRHRCVERWSMVTPWIGFPMKALMDVAAPLASAKYVRFESFLKPEMAPEQRGLAAYRYNWPYVEGLTVEEAANDLTFMVVGAYGKVLLNQFGSPIRLHTPWKYGFKSIKSITRISFVEERPIGTWEQLQPSEYGFWANVNPEVAHPRWSQAEERMIGQNDIRPTELFNGYGEEVAHLYAGLEETYGDRLWR